MALGRLNLDQVSESDLLSLIEAGVPEGIHYEYKSASYGKTDADVKEFLKDVSSFGNTAGGHLIIGMEAVDGAAANLVPLIGIDPDQEVLRLENLMRDGLEPRVTGARIKAVPISSGGFVILVRLPRSWNPPHRVSARNTNRFYVRNSAGVHETSVEELRVLFNVAATAHDRVRAFRHERISKIISGEGCVPLASDAADKFLLHIVPFSAFAEHNQVDLQMAHELRRSLHPIGADISYSRYNFDGFINGRGTDKCYGYTQLFRNGCIEAIRSRVLWQREGYKTIRLQKFVEHFLDVLPLYLNTLQALDVAPPLVVMLTLVEVSGARLEVGWNPFLDETVPIRQPVLELPEIVIEDYGTTEDYQREIRPALDALWNAGGYPGCNYFNEDGVWTGYT